MRCWGWSSTVTSVPCLRFWRPRDSAGAAGWRSSSPTGQASYRAAIERHLGHATHVVDRFHVVRWFAQGLIEVRRRVQRIGEPGK